MEQESIEEKEENLSTRQPEEGQREGQAFISETNIAEANTDETTFINMPSNINTIQPEN